MSAPKDAASLQPNAKIPFTLCDTSSKLLDAVKVLRKGGPLVVDCEGDKLGKVGGKLSLILVGRQASDPFHVYIVDVRALDDGHPNGVLHSLFFILQSERTVKIVYDGRMDYSQLYHEYGVTLRNVVDLTLADVASRIGGAEERLKRLVAFLPKFKINQKPGFYEDVQKLNSIGESLKERNISVPIKGKVDHTKWLERPLLPIQLQYVTMDLNMICQLSFALKGPITLVNDNVNTAFISLWRERQPDNADVYSLHPLLPCGIMPVRVNRKMVDSDHRQCEKCLRWYNQSDFAAADWKRAAESSRGQCRVCRTVSDVPKWLTKKKGPKNPAEKAGPGALV